MTKKISSRWVVKSDDSRYIINREKDGGLILLDCSVLEPNDPDSMEGLFYIAPSEADAFLALMKTALVLDAKDQGNGPAKVRAVKSNSKRG